MYGGSQSHEILGIKMVKIDKTSSKNIMKDVLNFHLMNY